MPESPEELYARIVAQVGESGRLPMPPVTGWEIFPWEVVDGALQPKVLGPPVPDEPARLGDPGGDPCRTCTGDGSTAIWENERWSVTPLPRAGMPLIVMLETREHLDFSDLGDELAAEYGRISVWLTRIIGQLPHVGRVHVCRWADGGAHCHVWFIARPARFPQVRGSMAVEWDAMLPPPPEDVWRADLAAVAVRLAHHDGRALV